MSQVPSRQFGCLRPRFRPQHKCAARVPFASIILGVAALLAGDVRPASAQWSSPAWVVGIQPSDQTQTSNTVNVTIRWCDKNFPPSSSRTITFKGQNVTSQFSYTYEGYGVYSCAYHYSGTAVYSAISQGTVTLTGQGIIDTLRAQYYNTNGELRQASQTWTPATYEVAVAPHGGVATPAPNATGVTQPFTITNHGNAGATYTLQVTCSGGVSGCSAPSSVTVWPGETQKQTVNVSYSTGAVDSKGTIELKATYGAYSDVGTVYAHMTATSTANTRVLVSEVNPGTSVDRASCLVFSIVPDVASECGALRVTHPLPSVRTLNKSRTATLVYYSDHVRPPVLGAHVILADTATIPDEVQLNILDGAGGSLAPSRNYPGSAWATSRAQRMAVPLNLTGATRIVAYQVEVKLRYGANWRPAAAIIAGEVAFVSRLESRFGAGWWMAGIEQLYPGQPVGTILWVAGDGTTRKYVRTGTLGSDTVFVAETLRRPDTLFRSAAGTYRRSLPNGVRTIFDGAGLHTQTVNRLGHTTRFVWGTAGGEPRLDSIVVPSASTVRAYTFHYDAEGRLNLATGPGGSSTQREVRFARKIIGGVPSRGVERIIDPDGEDVAFDFHTWGPDYAYRARIDRRDTRTDFDNEADAPTIAYASTPTGSGETVRHDFRTVTGMGASSGAGAVAVDSVYFRYDGPRTDVADVTKLWTDRFGALKRVANALGQTTTIRRDDWRFPAMVTRVEYPVLGDGRQRVQTSTFDSRGNVKTTTEVNPYGSDGKNRDAVTRYEYDNITWPAFVTRIVPPERDSVVIEYDADGSRYSQRDARGDHTKVYFRYGNSWKLLSSVTLPGGAKDSLRYSASLGNLSWTQGPSLDTTSISHDLAGRNTLVVTPFDSSRTRFTRVRTVFNVVDQVDTLITTGDAIGNYPTTSVFVVNTYDGEGNVKSVRRWSSRDIPLNNGRTTTIGQIITRWDYDLLHRKTREYAPDGTPDDTTDNPFDESRYDVSGNVDTVITRRGAVLTMSHDPLNRLKVSRVPRSMYSSRSGIIPTTVFHVEGGYEPERTSSYPRYPNDALNNASGYTIFMDSSVFVYDELGNVTRADNRDALVRRGYYLDGQIRGDTLKIRTIAELEAGGDTTSHVYALGYKYDLNGRRAELTHPGQLAPSSGQNKTQYAHDQAGNLAAVTDPLGYRYQFQYNARGELTNRALANGAALSETYTYEPDGSLASDVISGAMSRNVTYSYYPGGKLKDAKNSSGIRDTTWSAYTGLGHLGQGSLKSHGSRNSASTEGSQNFGIDALGNVFEVLSSSVYQDRNNVQTYLQQELRGFEHGTGRFSYSEPKDLSWNVVYKRDTTQYDAAGNVAFETTRLNYTPENTGVEIHDRAFYYSAQGQLRASDWRSYDFSRKLFQTAFDEYRYDALGRRVLLHTRRYCQGPVWGDCRLDWVRRIVWDESSELYEIQMPLNYAENDVTPIDLALETSPADNSKWDPNPFFGRVLYTHALGIDRPQSIIRLAYRTRLDTTRAYPLTNLLDFAPIPIVPLWDARGQPDIGMFAHVGAGDNCQTVNSRFYCSRIIWPGKYFAYDRPLGAPLYWHGSLIDDKRDPIGTHYRRNRYYDPKSGRFTQEDPIGLAGGLNLYGYASGDPINFSDPFGLIPVPLLILGGIALFEAASTAYDVYQAGKTLSDPNATTSDKAWASGGAIVGGLGLPGPGSLYAKAGREVASRLIRDASNNPGNWKTVGSFTEAATNKKAKGGVSIQTILENQAGDRVVRHTVRDKSGKEIDDHYRLMYKERDADRPK